MTQPAYAAIGAGDRPGAAAISAFGARLRALLFAAFALAPGFCAVSRGAERLGAYPVDASQISVAGVSSGAFMANQIHIAHSADVMGAAMIAGGLYGCAVIDVTRKGVLALASQAIGDCMSVPFLLDDVSTYRKRVGQLASRHWIDPPANLPRAKLYLFTGGSDSVVAHETVEKAKDLYSALGVPDANIVFVDQTGPAAEAGHSWVTVHWGNQCPLNKSPYIDDCDYDQAGEELKAIYGPDLAAPASPPTGRIVAFDQTEFAPGGAAKGNGFWETGYLYVPKACELGAAQPCRLQIVLHGCEQSAETLGDTFSARYVPEDRGGPVGQADVDLLAGAGGTEPVEHRRSPVGVDVPDDDRRPGLPRRGGVLVPTGLTGLPEQRRHLHRSSLARPRRISFELTPRAEICA